MLDLEKTIREYLPNVIHMSLATSLNNKPWVCEVHFAYDNELNLYFRSTSNRRHSQEIAQNKMVAGNIVEQHSLSQKPRGVYFEGEAELLENVDLNHIAFKMCKERFGSDESILEDAKKDDGHKFYKIKVNTFYVFDSRESKPSQKYELPWQK
jgi:uncharacterized protein YhbP (UPF0306 family)